MERKFDGSRLRFARLYRGKTLTELANETEISKQLISQYENNDSKPSYDRLAIITEALRFPYEFFIQADQFNPQADVTYFRSLLSAGRMDRSAQKYKLMMIGELYMALEEFVSFPIQNLPDVSFSGNDSDTDDTIHDQAQHELEECAMDTRRHWGLTDEPIGNFQFLLEQNGIIVSGYPTETQDIDAFSQRTLVGGRNLFIIAVDQGRKPEGRIRFDLAHELGHILIHPWSEALDEISREEFKMREDQANAFASAFLLPRESFMHDIAAFPTDLQYYLYLKKKWKVSVAAMLYRARTLNVLTPNQYQYLMRQYSKNGWRKHEPDDSPFILNENVFQGAIDTLFEAKYFTPATLMRFFGMRGINMYPEEIEELLHLRAGTLRTEEVHKQALRLKLVTGDDIGDADATSSDTRSE